MNDNLTPVVDQDQVPATNLTDDQHAPVANKTDPIALGAVARIMKRKAVINIERLQR